MTPEEEARKRHIPNPYTSEHCLWDSEPWPCNVSRLLATLDAERAADDRLREAAQAVVDDYRTWGDSVPFAALIADLRAALTPEAER